MKPLMIEDIEELKEKLLNPKPPLDKYWRNFLDLASSDPIGEFQALPPLAWLVTGEKRFEKNIRSVFMELSEALPSADASVEAQFHSYPMGSPVARFAIFLDWIWDSGILSDSERDALAGRIIDAIYSHCYLRLQGRLPAGDNQQASMSFACAVVGYIFGVRRGDSTIARKMFKEGINRYPNILMELFPDGWSGEGSTYQCQVSAPILALFTAFMEEITGKDYFNARLGDSTIREYLSLSCDIINNAGLLPGWDEYGVCAPELKTHLVYLARKTGDVKPLEKIERFGTWSENEILAWYNDDKVWSLIFWPDEQPKLDITSKNHSWLREKVCGKIISDNQQIDLLQMWDIMEGGTPSRSHLNPNNVEICANGMIHTVDGKGVMPADEIFDVPSTLMFGKRDEATAISAIKFHATQNGEHPTESEIRERAENTIKSWPLQQAYSTMNAHSLVIVDDEGHKFSRNTIFGSGENLIDLPSVKSVTGDVSEFYAELWGIDSMRRTSMIINDEIILIRDSFHSNKPHEYTWQLMLRPELEINGPSARQKLREGAELEILAPEETEFEVTEINGYAKAYEQKACKLSFTKKFNTAGAFSVAIAPHPGRIIVKDISKQWSVSNGGENPPDNLFALDAEVDLTSEYLGKPSDGDSIWFGKTINVSEKDSKKIQRLSIAKAQVDRLDIFVNGRRASRLFDDPSMNGDIPLHNKCDGRFWESHFDVSDLLAPGRNEIAIASSEFRGQVVSGPILLLEMVDEEERTIHSLSEKDEIVRIESKTEEWVILPDNREGVKTLIPRDVETNAINALIGNDKMIFAGVSHVRAPTFNLDSDARIDVELAKNALFVDIGGAGDVEVEFRINDYEFAVKQKVCVEVTGDVPPELRIRTDLKTPMFVNAHCLTLNSKPCEFQKITLKSDSRDPRLNRFQSKYEAGVHPAYDAYGKKRLLASLRSSEWRECVAAVEQVGDQGCEWAVEELISLFEKEMRKNIYAKINKNWSFAKMKIKYNGIASNNETSEDGKRRYRLKLAIIQALTKLKAAEAAEPLITRTLAEATDFYPVMVQACLAAGELELTSVKPLLANLADAFERNTREAALLAIKKMDASTS